MNTLDFVFPNRVEFVVFDMFLASFSDGECAVGQRYRLSFCAGDPG